MWTSHRGHPMLPRDCINKQRTGEGNQRIANALWPTLCWSTMAAYTLSQTTRFGSTHSSSLKCLLPAFYLQ